MALIITMVTQTLPTAVFMLKSYFDTIPDEIEEAAMMDGLNRLQIIFVSPYVAMSGLISVCLLLLWWRGTTICLRRFSSSASNFTLTSGPERAVQYARLRLGTDDGGLLVTALPVR